MPVRSNRSTPAPLASGGDIHHLGGLGPPLSSTPHPPHPGMCPMVPHVHNDPFYCSPFGTPYYR
ncbi:UNVERIFIED_CONTAM: hypothetical protein PYX00_007007 [Menopon gallinae]|uniref:Uncharacterized protein n=1 Tax=Menopon gallinae TaxID=328185 RepID=A0AAW2HH78_9NEOP